MARLNEEEKAELLRLAESFALKEDLHYVAAHRHNPVVVNGIVDMDRLLDFLTQLNEFINHQPKPFKPIIDTVMKLQHS